MENVTRSCVDSCLFVPHALTLFSHGASLQDRSSGPACLRQLKGFLPSAAPETIIIRVLPLLDYNREYNIQTAQIPPPALARQSASDWGKKDKCAGDCPNYPEQMLAGEMSHILCILDRLRSNIRRFSHQRFL